LGCGEEQDLTERTDVSLPGRRRRRRRREGKRRRRRRRRSVHSLRS